MTVMLRCEVDPENGGAALARRRLRTVPEKGSLPAYSTPTLNWPNRYPYSFGPARPAQVNQNLVRPIFLSIIFIYFYTFFYTFNGPVALCPGPESVASRARGVESSVFNPKTQQKHKTLKLTKMIAQRTISKVLFQGLERV